MSIGTVLENEKNIKFLDIFCTKIWSSRSGNGSKPLPTNLLKTFF